jgi:hemoglobin
LNQAGPPQVSPPSAQIFEIMGSQNIVQMLEDFYIELEKSDIRSMFPEDMSAASRKSAAYFIGLCGGPPLYHQLYGHPRLRQRHMPFPVDQKALLIWLDCFKKILENAPEKYSFPEEHLPGFITFLEGFSPWMVNS